MLSIQEQLEISSKAAVVYVGWIPFSLRFHSKRQLRRLGVRGKIRWRFVETIYGFAAFESCEATDEVMRRLIGAGLRYPGAFTGLDEDGRQTHLQKYRRRGG